MRESWLIGEVDVGSRRWLRWNLAALVILALVLLVAGCGGDIPLPDPGDPPDDPPEQCTGPPADTDPEIIWRGPHQVEIVWPVMDVCGGDEAYVWRDRVSLALPAGMVPTNVGSFMGYYVGDRVESLVVAYNAPVAPLGILAETFDAESVPVIYDRSPHLGGECGPDCYEAKRDGPPLSAEVLQGLVVDTECRVVEPNTQNGELKAGCHHSFILTMEAEGEDPPDPPDPPACSIPHSEAPGWALVNPKPPSEQAITEKVKEAIAILGDHCGEPELEVQGLLADQLLSMGVCARRWSDTNPGHNIAILRSDGDFEEWDATAGNGCWRNNNRGVYMNTWAHGGDPNACGAPTPPPLHHFRGPKEKACNPWCDATPYVCDGAYCAAIGFTDGRSCCAVRLEGAADRAACERYVVGGDALWRADPGPVKVKSNNHLRAKCAPGAVCDWIEACHSDGTRCNRKEF